MAVTVADIDRWRERPSETEALEFKEAKTQLDFNAVLRDCVALGNEGDGYLLLGITNKPPRKVVGTNAVSNPVAMTEKIYGKLGFRVHLEAVAHPDGRVVVFSIPSRPRGSAYSLDGQFLMRVGQSIQPMSTDQLRKLLSDTTPEWLEESTANVSATELLRLLEIDLFFSRLGTTRPTNTSRAIARFVQARLVDDLGGGRFSIRRLAALIFAKQLEDFPDLKRKAPRVVAYSGTTKVSDPIENTIGGKGYAVGFKGLMRFVMDRVPGREVIRDGVRSNERIIPEIAIREL